MDKKYSFFITVLFCVFLAGFGAVHVILPDREFSEQENRQLDLFKAPTLETVRDGKFMEDFEDYISDQFPLRDGWIQLKAVTEKTLGKQENNKAYFGTDGQTLFAHFPEVTDEELAQRVGYVNALAENVDLPVYFSIIPDKSYVWADRLPENAPNVDDGSTIDKAAALCGDKVNWIDLKDALSGDDAFYRTDHHWTTFGAYQAFNALAAAMGDPVLLLGSEPVLRSDSFYGTTWSSAGAGWVKPDSMYTLVPEGGLTGRTTVTRYPEGKPIPGSLYDLEQLSVKDKYKMFLGGNQPLGIIQNPDAQGGKLLVIRDSYSDTLAPFLSLNDQEVHLYDLRYNRLSVKNYVEENGIDRVLVLYSASNFVTDSNLFLMGL